MKKFRLVLALLICAYSISLMASDVSTAEREFNAIQKELQQFNTKYKKAQQKQEQLQADYNEALLKVEELKEKPKSLPYKNAVKKCESLSAKIAKNASELETLNLQKDSLLKVVEEKQSTLLAAQQAENDANQAQNDEKEAKKLAKEQAKLAKQLARDSAKLAKEHEREQKKSLHEQEYSATTQEVNYKYTSEDNNSNTTSQSTSHQSSSNEGEDWPQLLIILGLIILGAILAWFDFKKKHHCPKCGKWFTMHFERGRRTRDENQKMVFRSVRRCSNCGYEATFFEPIKK